MASGDRTRRWFPEMVSQLRESWQSDATWDVIIELRKSVQHTLDHIISSRGIKPAIFRCPHCVEIGPAAPPVISVRAMLLALSRFGIESDETVRRLEKAWVKHRSLHKLDLYGSTVDATATVHHGHHAKIDLKEAKKILAEKED